MSAAALYISVHPFGPFGEQAWLDRFAYVVEELKGEYGAMVTMRKLGEPDIEVMFLFYLIDSHRDVVENRVLERLTVTPNFSFGHLIICALGRNRRGNTVSLADVQSVAMSQVPPHLRYATERVGKPEDLDEVIRTHLSPKMRSDTPWATLDRKTDLSESAAVSASLPAFAPYGRGDL